jgi:hypothetical protein
MNYKIIRTMTRLRLKCRRIWIVSGASNRTIRKDFHKSNPCSEKTMANKIKYLTLAGHAKKRSSPVTMPQSKNTIIRKTMTVKISVMRNVSHFSTSTMKSLTVIR